MKLVYQKPSSELLDGFLIALLVTFGVCYTQGLFVMVFVLAFRLLLAAKTNYGISVPLFGLWLIMLMILIDIEGMRIGDSEQFSIPYNSAVFLCAIMVQLILMHYQGDIIKVIKVGTIFASLMAGMSILSSEYSMLMYRWGDFIAGHSGYRLGISSDINPNVIAWSFGFLALLAIFMFICDKSLLLLAVCVFDLLIVFFTGSKNGLILALLPVLYYGIKMVKKVNIKALFLIAIGIVFFWVAIHQSPVLYTLIGKRIDSALFTIGFNDGAGLSGDVVDVSSTEKRLDMIGFARKMFLEKPVLGWGIGAFAVYSGFGYYCHNNYMEILVSGGIVLFLIYYIPILLVGSKIFTMEKGKEKDLALILLLTIFIMDFSTVNFYSNLIFLLRTVVLYEVVMWNQKGKVITHEEI